MTPRLHRATEPGRALCFAGIVEQHDHAHWIARTLDGAELGEFRTRGEALDALAAVRGWRVESSAHRGGSHRSRAHAQNFCLKPEIPAVSRQTTEKGERLFLQFLARAWIFRASRDFQTAHSEGENDEQRQ
jgi:hypothetical protein